LVAGIGPTTNPGNEQKSKQRTFFEQIEKNSRCEKSSLSTENVPGFLLRARHICDLKKEIQIGMGFDIIIRVWHRKWRSSRGFLDANQRGKTEAGKGGWIEDSRRTVF
jgi:hypothetical protein